MESQDQKRSEEKPPIEIYDDVRERLGLGHLSRPVQHAIEIVWPAAYRAGREDAAPGAPGFVWAVVFSNYEPAEVDGLYAEEAAARERVQALGDGWHAERWAVVGASELPEVEAIRKILDLHRPGSFPDCRACGDTYPCETVKIARGSLGSDRAEGCRCELVDASTASSGPAFVRGRTDDCPIHDGGRTEAARRKAREG